MNWPRRGLVLLGTLALAALIVGFSRRPWSAPTRPKTPSTGQPQRLAERRERAIPAVSTLYEKNTSAYQARLFPDPDGVVLVTQTGFSVLGRAEAAEEHTISLGPVAARQGDSIVFWRSGWLRQIPLSGGDERNLAALSRPPQYLLASESRLGWIYVDRRAGASLWTLSAGEVRVVRETRQQVRASVLRDAVVYWILQAGDDTWRIGSIGLDGQGPMLTGAHRGRPPAMLALGADGVYFYDGPERGVRRLSFDLEREDAVSAHVICSPLAVSDRAICAHVGGIFDISSRDRAPHFLASETAGPITAVAATLDRAFWIADAGADQLVVRSVPLSAR